MSKIDKIFLVCLILTAAFVRLWRISSYMTFLGDEGRDIATISNIIKGHKYTLIGPGTSIGNMYLGPWYYYLMIPAVALTNFSPVGPSIMVGLFGIATVFLLWWITRIWIDKNISWLIGFLYALSPTVITYSRSSWNPNIMPFFALLSIYTTWAIYRYQKYYFFPILAFSLAMVLNSHYLGLLLFPVITIYLFLPIKKYLRNPALTSNLFKGVTIFVLMMSPLLFFDARHGWQNFSALKQFFTVRQQTVNLQPQKSLPNLWPIWVSVNSSLLTIKNLNLAQALSLISGLSTIVFALKYRRSSPQYMIILLWLCFAILGLGLYKQHIYDHYFGFIFPAVFLSLAIMLKSFGKFIGFLIFLFLLIINLRQNPLLYEPNNQLWRTRQVANFINSQSQGKPYNLALISNHNYDASYRYFLNNNYRSLHEKITDQLFVICENPVCGDIVNSPLWEIAGFGWSRVNDGWSPFPWDVKLFRLVHNPSGNHDKE